MSTFKSFGTMSVVTINAANAGGLAKRSLALISELRALESKFNTLAAEASEFSIERRRENEGDLEYLGRITRAASAKAHELAAEEDAKRVEIALSSNSKPRRSGVAGFLDRTADRLAAL